MAVFQTTCWLCGRPLVFPFSPHQPKTCEDCYTPRDPADIESRIIKQQMAKFSTAVVRDEDAGAVKVRGE